jgi:K+-transporting ATPase c subunit
VLAVIDSDTVRRPLGILGDDAVNVLRANIALDQLAGP